MAAIEVAVKGCLRPTKWAYLLKRSTTTKIVSNFSDFGNPSIALVLEEAAAVLQAQE